MKKEMRKRRKTIMIISIVIFAVLLGSIASAGFFDWLKETITGRASTTQQTNVSISVTGVNRVTISVWNDSFVATSPTEGSNNYIMFNVTVTDTDGNSDINDSSVRAEFINGSIIRANATCAPGGTTTNSQNFSCGIDLWYFDLNGQWRINVTANDLGNKTYVSNYSTDFIYSQLQSIVITPQALSWPSVSPGGTNQTSNNDPTSINNTGNYNATGNLQVQGYNLYGANGEFINVANLTVDIETNTTCTGAECIECGGTNLVNGSAQSVIGSVLERGNLTAGGKANETIYYCIRQIPSGISSQTYSTQNTGGTAWIVKII